MQLNEYKKYYPFIFTGIIALASLVSVVFIGYTYIASQDAASNNEAEVLEVKLPIMSWSQYSTLSKKYENGIVSSVKTVDVVVDIVDTPVEIPEETSN